MSAAEFVEFWRSVQLVAMATVGPAGQPHIAPVHAELAGMMLRLRIYEDTVRRPDLATNPASPSPPGGLTARSRSLYGRAREVPSSLRPARPGQSGRPRRVVTIEVQLTRIYAMRAPERESSLPHPGLDPTQRPAPRRRPPRLLPSLGCISTEASCDTIQVLLPGAPTEPQAELQIRTCLGAWLATHPGVEAEIIA
jgi:hypothetical protein